MPFTSTETSPQIRSQQRSLDNRHASTAPEACRSVSSALVTCGILRRTEPAVAAKLSRHLEPVYFPPGRTVFAQGDAGSNLYVVMSGKVKVSYQCPDSRENVLTILGPGEIFGELTVFDLGPRQFGVTALTEVSALTLNRDQLLAWMAEYPEISEQMLRMLARRVDLITNCLMDILFVDVSQLVAKRLLQLAKRFGRREDDSIRVTHHLPLCEFSQLAGADRDTVDAVLRDFTDRGWIRVENECVIITDSSFLRHHLAADADRQPPSKS